MVARIRWVTAERARSAVLPPRRARPPRPRAAGQVLDHGVELGLGPVGPARGRCASSAASISACRSPGTRRSQCLGRPVSSMTAPVARLLGRRRPPAPGSAISSTRLGQRAAPGPPCPWTSGRIPPTARPAQCHRATRRRPARRPRASHGTGSLAGVGRRLGDRLGVDCFEPAASQGHGLVDRPDASAAVRQGEQVVAHTGQQARSGQGRGRGGEVGPVVVARPRQDGSSRAQEGASRSPPRRRSPRR